MERLRPELVRWVADGPPGKALFGFESRGRGVHSSRTLMLPELRRLLGSVRADATFADCKRAILEENVLGKRTAATRRETCERLRVLYALNPGIVLFRCARRLWDLDPDGQSLLALLLASARDPLIRLTAPVILAVEPGNQVLAAGLEEPLSRLPWLSGETRKKAAVNVLATWTQAGFLRGRNVKVRTHPMVTHSTVTYALLLGYLTGLRGIAVFASFWTQLLDQPLPDLKRLAVESARRGWMVFKCVGDVAEVRFPGLISPEEDRASLEPD